MAKTMTLANDIIPAVRLLLKDSDTPYHWSDADIIVWANNGCRDIRNKIQEARFSGLSEDTYTAVTLTSDTLDLGDVYRELLIEFIVWKCYEQDNVDEYTKLLADRHMQQYLGGIG